MNKLNKTLIALTAAVALAIAPTLPASAAAKFEGGAKSCSYPGRVIVGSTAKGKIYHYVNYSLSPSASWNNSGYVFRSSSHGQGIDAWKAQVIGAGGDVSSASTGCAY